MQSQTSGNGMWLIVIVLAVVAAVMNMIGGSTSSTVSAPSVNRDTFEHRYATERFRQEGLNRSEAQQAADAVIKFHNAQKNR